MDWITAGLVERGVPEHIARAFAINAMDESGMKPDINEIAPLVPGSRGGYGAMQWTGPRRRGLEAFAAERGLPVSDQGLQLDYLMYELNGPEAAAWSKIRGAKDTGGAAAAIVTDFLRPAPQHRESRVAKYLGGTYAMPEGQNALAMPGAGSAQNALAAPEDPRPPAMANLLDPRSFMTAARFDYAPVRSGRNG